MEWLLIITWLLIINGALGGQYLLNWMGNQPRFVGNKEVGITPGVMTWWREISKFAWAAIAVAIEIIRGKELKFLWPGIISMITIIICALTGVVENIGFFYLPRYYSPHIYAPYVNIYLAFLPFFGKFLFKASIRKEHWIGISLVVLGLTFPYIPRLTGGAVDPKSVLDDNAILWIVIINCCLCSQHVLNNKTVQTSKAGVGPNALVVWREIWKMLFITIALLFFPFVSQLLNIYVPERIPVKEFETRIIDKIDRDKTETLLNYYVQSGDNYVIGKKLSDDDREKIKEIIGSSEYNRFFALFGGTIIPKNWWPILFVVLAGLTGYIYSFGFFKLARFAAHFWVPYTNVYLAVIPFVMIFFGENVTGFQIAGAAFTTLGLMVGVIDYKRNKVEEIERKNYDSRKY